MTIGRGRILAGPIAGAMAYVLGLATTLVVETGDVDPHTLLFRGEYLPRHRVQGTSAPSVYRETLPDGSRLELAAWFYNQAHFATNDGIAGYRVVTDAARGSAAVSLEFVGEPSAVTYLVPVVVLGGGGYLVGRWVGVDDVSSTLRCSVAVTSGYALLAVLTVDLLAAQWIVAPGPNAVDHIWIAFSLGPDPVSTLLLTGLVYPVVASTAGAYLALSGPGATREWRSWGSNSGLVTGRPWPRIGLDRWSDAGLVRDGVLAGVASFVVGLVLTILFVRPAHDDVLFAATSPRDEVGVWASFLASRGDFLHHLVVAPGWLYHQAHFAPIDVSVASAPADPVAFSYVLGPPFLLHLVPVVLLACAGAVLTARSRPGTVSGSARAGARVVAGYLPVAFVSILLLRGAVAHVQSPSVVTAGPDLLVGTVVTGVVFPVAFGALGGLLHYGVFGSRFGPLAPTEAPPESAERADATPSTNPASDHPGDGREVR